ncbi:MAG: RNA pseudouridine synthase [Planctomycetaceae bacterium]|nr:RNA pseudouridine synthase [Planctomycetales bacterium]MCB9925632.1 RNA pseudouridine synthase [Planctomycetaceae bacterium]
MQPNGFAILYEQGPCLVVSKPAGILTQAPPGIDSLEFRIKQFLIQRENKPGRAYLGVPHRLDRPVSGALVVAKHVRAARRLSEQFEGRIVQKTYWAVVEGELATDQGRWIDRVRKVPNEARSEVVADDQKDARRAVLSYQVRLRFEGKTWLEITLETGRYHQIRVQASSHGHPVVGDALYGATTSFGPSSDDPRDLMIALHARDLTFRHPMTKEDVSVTAPLPPAWSEFGDAIIACDDGESR